MRKNIKIWAANKYSIILITDCYSILEAKLQYPGYDYYSLKKIKYFQLNLFNQVFVK